VPSVASESNVALSHRVHSPKSSPMSRNASQAASREPATPFAALLDSADPACEPRTERPQRTDRADAASPAGDRRADAPKPAKDRDADRDGRVANGTDDPTGSREASNDAGAKKSKKTKEKTDAERPADASGKPQPTADATAGLEAAPGNDASTVTPPNAAAAVAVAQPAAADPVATAPEAPPQAEQLAEVPATGGCGAPEHATGPAAAPGQVDPAQDGQPAQLPAQETATQAQAADAQTGQTPSQRVGPQQPAAQQAEAQVAKAKDAKAKDAKVQGGQALQASAQQASAQQARARGDEPVDPSQDGDAPAPAPQGEAGRNGKPHVDSEGASSSAARPAGRLSAENVLATHSQKHGDPAGAVKAGSEAMQNLGLWTPASQANAAANAASAAASAPTSQAIAVPMAALAVEIAAQAHAGKHRFEIRLDPPELGRIDVRLDIDRDGRVTSRLVVDRSETLDLLKRDAPQLERALQQAGLKMSDNALEFALRQHAFGHDDTPSPNASQLIVAEDEPAPREALQQSYRRLIGLGGGLDIRV